jgi:hypothetical protein
VPLKKAASKKSVFTGQAKVTPSPKVVQSNHNLGNLKKQMVHKGPIVAFLQPKSGLTSVGESHASQRLKQLSTSAKLMSDHDTSRSPPVHPSKDSATLETSVYPDTGHNPIRRPASVPPIRTNSQLTRLSPKDTVRYNEEIVYKSIRDQTASSSSCLPQKLVISITPSTEKNQRTKTTSVTAHATRKPAANNAAWSEARRVQQRTQKSAFSRKNENPFTKYKHDPNDTEFILDTLVQQVTPSRTSPDSSIIPGDSHRVIDNAYSNNFSQEKSPLGPLTSHVRRNAHPEPRQQRRFSSTPRLSEQEILNRKAQELQEMSILMDYGTPNYQEDYPPEQHEHSTVDLSYLNSGPRQCAYLSPVPGYHDSLRQPVLDRLPSPGFYANTRFGQLQQSNYARTDGEVHEKTRLLHGVNSLSAERLHVGQNDFRAVQPAQASISDRSSCFRCPENLFSDDCQTTGAPQQCAPNHFSNRTDHKNGWISEANNVHGQDHDDMQQFQDAFF